jgi:hypothetical protein
MAMGGTAGFEEAISIEPLSGEKQITIGPGPRLLYHEISLRAQSKGMLFVNEAKAIVNSHVL